MQLDLPPDLANLVHRRIASGAYSNAEEVVRRALEAQAAEEDWTDEERLAASQHIEEGYQYALRGEFLDPLQARQKVAEMKAKWLREQFPGR